mmetsp:Transcript_112158/g.312182  ORF Transcript_112158/g.312182 Transcript_112158/m.312182 type:complete len:217 (-) Transcript_112158:173-823(-)
MDSQSGTVSGGSVAPQARSDRHRRRNTPSNGAALGTHQEARNDGAAWCSSPGRAWRLPCRREASGLSAARCRGLRRAGWPCQRSPLLQPCRGSHRGTRKAACWRAPRTQRVPVLQCCPPNARTCCPRGRTRPKETSPLVASTQPAAPTARSRLRMPLHLRACSAEAIACCPAGVVHHQHPQRRWHWSICNQPTGVGGLLPCRSCPRCSRVRAPPHQ